MQTEEKLLQYLLRKYRKEVGLSQQALANLLQKPQSFVSKYESGERRLDILEIRKICQCVGITLPSFVEELENALKDHHECQSEI